jgi:5-formyltetrahydrofolate cyclo-ligase
MAQEDHVAALASLLSSYGTFVTYQPLRTEAAFEFISFPIGAERYEIPPRAALDPIEEAKKVMAFAADGDAALFIPGRKFDASGTRHGQGGGWYDRFLAAVPRQWLRIGFCFDDQFSPIPLVRENWDQAMDYVVVVNRANEGFTLYSSEGVYHHDKSHRSSE